MRLGTETGAIEGCEERSKGSEVNDSFIRSSEEKKKNLPRSREEFRDEQLGRIRQFSRAGVKLRDTLTTDHSICRASDRDHPLRSLRRAYRSPPRKR